MILGGFYFLWSIKTMSDNDKAKKITETAIQMSRCTHISFEQAVWSLEKSLMIIANNDTVMAHIKRMCKDKPFKYLIKYIFYNFFKTIKRIIK
jgi:hypothetical protein